MRRALVAILALVPVAAGCGSGSSAGSDPAQVVIHAAERRGGCPPAAPRVAPYRGPVVLAARDGRRRVGWTDRRGAAELTIAAGSYRVVWRGLPFPRLLGVRVDGRAVPRAPDGGFGVTLRRGRTTEVRVLVGLRPPDCNALGGAAA